MRILDGPISGSEAIMKKLEVVENERFEIVEINTYELRDDEWVKIDNDISTIVRLLIRSRVEYGRGNEKFGHRKHLKRR